MASTATEIKNIITSHLRRAMFGMEIYGRHDIAGFDGKQDTVTVIEVYAASRYERYGIVRVYHPTHGKWQATLLSEHHCGKPVQVFTAEDIRASIAVTPSQDFVYRVYGGEKPDVAPVAWDAYWQAD